MHEQSSWRSVSKKSRTLSAKICWCKKSLLLPDKGVEDQIGCVRDESCLLKLPRGVFWKQVQSLVETKVVVSERKALVEVRQGREPEELRQKHV